MTLRLFLSSKSSKIVLGFSFFFIIFCIISSPSHAQLIRINVEHQMYVDPAQSEATLTLSLGPWRGTQLNQFSPYAYVETFCTDQSRTGNSLHYLGTNDFIGNRFEGGVIQLPLANFEEGVRIDCLAVFRSKLAWTLDHPIAFSDFFTIYRSKL